MRIFAAILFVLFSTTAMAKNGGFTVNPSLWLWIPSADSKVTQESESRTDADGDLVENVDQDVSKDSSKMVNLYLNVGAGLTMNNGLFLGGKGLLWMSVWDGKSNTDYEDGDTTDTKYSSSDTLTALGPSIGWASKSGFSASAAWFPKVNYKSKSKTKFDYTRSFSDSTTTSNTTGTSETTRDKFRGWQVDMGYRFEVGKVDFGPQLVVTRFTYNQETDVDRDVTVTEDEERETSSVKEEEGTFHQTMIQPNLAAWINF